MSSDTTTENTGTPEGQAANHSPDGAPPGGDGTGAPASAREAQSAKRYGQMNDAQRARIEAQFDGRERDEAYNRAWCDAVDALWEREGDDTPPTEASATATGTAPDAKGATADRVDPEKFFRAFLGAQSDESRRRLADATFVLFSKLGAPEGATAAEASKPTAKPEPINWAPLFDGVVAYVGERIADGSAQDFVTNFVDDTIRDAVRDALDERVPEDVHPRLYESVVEFARAAKSPGERMMWVRMARRLERDGEPGFVERMITEWTRARSERVGVVLHTV
ncbi:MAG TPA: hypothetical protein PK141_06995, partial [Polyangiaceae bacterium]|nr:hypothetical protein [Polyangiaceae bacterium]